VEEKRDIESLRVTFLSEAKEFGDEVPDWLAFGLLANKVETCKTTSVNQYICHGLRDLNLPAIHFGHRFLNSTHSSKAASTEDGAKDLGVQ
jgi:hypothetical protein